MSDDAQTPTPDSTPTPTPADVAPADLAHADEKPIKWVPVAAVASERAERKAAEKRAADAEARVQAFEDANKSELEKAAARAEAAEKALEAERTARLRAEVASEAGIPADLRDFLTGSDEESLRAQADKLKAAMATSTEPRSPRPDPSQGAKPANSGPSQLTKADMASMTPQQIEQARTEGRFNDLLAGKQ